jgi:hypothetical protein
MQPILGTPSVFLTVTFDDKNSLIMQVMSGHLIDDDRDISVLSKMDLAEWASERKELHLNHPGLGSLNFELLLELVSKEVIGWSMRDHVRTKENGLFGECEGVAAAMEEQGCHTVHVHFSIWIKGFSKLRNDLFFGDKVERVLAGQILPDYYAHISSTELFGCPKTQAAFVTALNHENCVVPLCKRTAPTVVGNQQLRNLCHRLGYLEDITFAMCKHCGHGYTYEDLVGLYCQPVGIADQKLTLQLESVSCHKEKLWLQRARCTHFVLNSRRSRVLAPLILRLLQ